MSTSKCTKRRTISLLSTLVFLVHPLEASANNYFVAQAQNENGITSLMNAAMDGDARSTEVLISAGSNVNEKNKGGATALHIASRMNNTEVIKVLLSKGANINATDNEKWTPLMRASINGNKESVKLLLDEKNVNIWLKNKWGETALIHAATSNCTECIKNITQKTSEEGKVNYKDRINAQIKESQSILDKKRNSEAIAVLSEFKDNLNGVKKEEPIEEETIELEKTETSANSEAKEAVTASGKTSEKTEKKEEPIDLKTKVFIFKGKTEECEDAKKIFYKDDPNSEKGKEYFLDENDKESSIKIKSQTKSVAVQKVDSAPKKSSEEAIETTDETKQKISILVNRENDVVTLNSEYEVLSSESTAVVQKNDVSQSQIITSGSNEVDKNYQSGIETTNEHSVVENDDNVVNKLFIFTGEEASNYEETKVLSSDSYKEPKETIVKKTIGKELKQNDSKVEKVFIFTGESK